MKYYSIHLSRSVFVKTIITRTVIGPDFNRAAMADRLALSTLGGFLDCTGFWPSGEIQIDTISLELWRHIVTLGRDHYVKIVRRGYLLPFGMRAVWIRVSERKIESHKKGVFGAWIMQRDFVVVREPSITYFSPDGENSSTHEFNGRKLPFHRIDIKTKVTPDFIRKSISGDENVKAFRMTLSESDIHFLCCGFDREGRSVEFSMPMVFADETMFNVNSSGDEELKNLLLSSYNGLPEPSRNLPSCQ